MQSVLALAGGMLSTLMTHLGHAHAERRAVGPLACGLWMCAGRFHAPTRCWPFRPS
jgi:hypothetical protein